MNTWNPTDHPRGRLGRFKAKARTEPEAVAESTPTRGRDGSIKWRTVDGRMHRTDGPAATWPDGPEVCFFDGKVLHVLTTRNNGMIRLSQSGPGVGFVWISKA